MPYIITTTADDPHVGTPAMERVTVTRIAVATLDEARRITAREYREHVHRFMGFDTRWITESGGTVGPLPDGTVIEVQSVSWNWIIGMADDAGIDTDAVYEDGGDLAILAAFNGAQA